MTKIPALFVCTLLAFFTAAAQAQHGSHGGVDARGCHIDQNNHQIHYTAFLAPSETDPGLMVEAYCELVPNIGLLRATLDLVDQNTRDNPVAVRLLGLPADSNGASAILIDLPSKMYPSGSISIDHSFERAGRYEFKIRFGQNPTDSDMMTIAFSVGIRSWTAELKRYIIPAAVLAATAFLLWLILRWRPQTPMASDASQPNIQPQGKKDQT